MKSDSELLAYVRRETQRRRRRRQTVTGSAVAVAVLSLGAIAVAVNQPTKERVQITPGPAATTTEAPTSTISPTTDSTTSTAPLPDPSTTTTPVVAPDPSTTTTPRPRPPVTDQASANGVTVTATATQDPNRPGWVGLRVRVQSNHGSHPGGTVRWPGVGPTMFGLFAELGETSCDDLIDDDPATNPPPDPGAGPVDQTFELEQQLTSGTTALVEIDAAVSWCTADEGSVILKMPITLG